MANDHKQRQAHKKDNKSAGGQPPRGVSWLRETDWNPWSCLD